MPSRSFLTTALALFASGSLASPDELARPGPATPQVHACDGTTKSLAQPFEIVIVGQTESSNVGLPDLRQSKASVFLRPDGTKAIKFSKDTTPTQFILSEGALSAPQDGSMHLSERISYGSYTDCDVIFTEKPGSGNEIAKIAVDGPSKTDSQYFTLWVDDTAANLWAVCKNEEGYELAYAYANNKLKPRGIELSGAVEDGKKVVKQGGKKGKKGNNNGAGGQQGGSQVAPCSSVTLAVVGDIACK